MGGGIERKWLRHVCARAPTIAPHWLGFGFVTQTTLSGILLLAVVPPVTVVIEFEDVGGEGEGECDNGAGVFASADDGVNGDVHAHSPWSDDLPSPVSPQLDNVPIGTVDGYGALSAVWLCLRCCCCCCCCCSCSCCC